MRAILSILAGLALLAVAPAAFAQTRPFPRLPAAVLDVLPPAERVQGPPREMAVRQRACRVLPTAETRRRVVDLAVQEWGFFGFLIAQADEVEEEPSRAEPSGAANAGTPGSRGRRRPRLSLEESLRVAASIAGYWAVTAEGGWIVARQNEAWRGEYGVGARWEFPWSAAFISWVMCEAGLGTAGQFQRAVGHHTYIDQAIRARDGLAAQAAFTAHDAGEAIVEPGDLLCTSRRPVYRTIAERRRHAGVGARTHCDIVVQVEDARTRFLVIGGNVRGVVAMKLLPASRGAYGLRPIDRSASPNARPVFAHLKLIARSIGPNGLDSSPTIKALSCDPAFQSPVRLLAANLAPAGSSSC
jgi:hypothetical protein